VEGISEKFFVAHGGRRLMKRCSPLLG